MSPLLTATGLCVIAAFVITLLSAIGRVPLWVATLLLCLAMLLSFLPK
jgi:hypothetical protein